MTNRVPYVWNEKQCKSTHDIQTTMSSSSVDEPRRTYIFTAIGAIPIYRIIARVVEFLRTVGFLFHGVVSLRVLPLSVNGYV